MKTLLLENFWLYSTPSYTHKSYVAEYVVARFILQLKNGEVPRCYSIKHLQLVVLCVLDEVIVQQRLLIPAKVDGAVGTLL